MSDTDDLLIQRLQQVGQMHFDRPETEGEQRAKQRDDLWHVNPTNNLFMLTGDVSAPNEYQLSLREKLDTEQTDLFHRMDELNAAKDARLTTAEYLRARKHVTDKQEKCRSISLLWKSSRHEHIEIPNTIQAEQANPPAEPVEQQNRSFFQKVKNVFSKDPALKKYEDIGEKQQAADYRLLQNPKIEKKLKSHKVEISRYVNGEEQIEKTTEDVVVERVRKGDYRAMESLNAATRYLLADEFIHDNQDLFLADIKETVKKIKGAGLGGERNPLIRIGISLGMRNQLSNSMGRTPEYFQQLDEALNTSIMVDTIVTDARVGGEISKEDVTLNLQTQMFVAKLMLMGQLGKFEKTTDEHKEKWDGTVANAFAHCSRVGVSMPSNEGDDLAKNHFLPTLGTKEEKNKPFVKRTAATHSLERKRKDGKGEFKEIKTKITSFTNQYGMNLAVGGLGKAGIPAGDATSTLKRDGSCGHLYMRYDAGDSKHHTGFLFGFESDAYKTTNQTGHTHGLGNPEFASSFGGQRTDEIADKYGGRNIDASAYSADLLTKIIDGFSNYFQQVLYRRETLFNSTNVADYMDLQADITAKMEKLCGKTMSSAELNTFLETLGIQLTDEEKAQIARNRE